MLTAMNVPVEISPNLVMTDDYYVDDAYGVVVVRAPVTKGMLLVDHCNCEDTIGRVCVLVRLIGLSLRRPRDAPFLPTFGRPHTRDVLGRIVATAAEGATAAAPAFVVVVDRVGCCFSWNPFHPLLTAILRAQLPRN